MERVHVRTDHDRLEQERYNERIDRERITGRITIFQAEWAKYMHAKEVQASFDEGYYHEPA